MHKLISTLLTLIASSSSGLMLRDPFDVEYLADKPEQSFSEWLQQERQCELVEFFNPYTSENVSCYAFVDKNSKACYPTLCQCQTGDENC